LLLRFVEFHVKPVNFVGMSKSLATISDFLILQGNAAAQLRLGGRPCNSQWKNLENSLHNAEVMIKNEVIVFFEW